MNEDTENGRWDRLPGKIKAKWGELTQDKLERSKDRVRAKRSNLNLHPEVVPAAEDDYRKAYFGDRWRAARGRY